MKGGCGKEECLVGLGGCEREGGFEGIEWHKVLMAQKIEVGRFHRRKRSR